MYSESNIKRKDITSHLQFHNDDVPFLTMPSFSVFQQEILHGFSTRLGGSGTGEIGSMNLSFHKAESQEEVASHYRRIGSALGFEPENVVCTKQTHTINIRQARDADRGKGFSLPRDYSDVDGLVTDEPGLVLTTYFADCVPLLLFDPHKKVIGAAHSGWRGTVNKMGIEMVRRMVSDFSCDPSDIITGIGPSICQDCYEVSEDVIHQFKEAYPSEQWDSLFYPTIPGKFHLNLQNACERNFLDAGISADHITKPDICTACNPDLLYSHRKAGGKEGNFGGFIMLR